MMSSDNTPPGKPPPGTKGGESLAAGGGGGGGASSRAKPTSSSSSGAKQQHPPPEQSLKCPRCDSPNTKFCYYNNYSLTQPRHFCKTCRRYWTKGGALRNVPIGGGCRKNKRVRSSSSNSRLSCSLDSKDSAGSSSSENMMLGGLKFFHGISPPMDFQLGGLSSLPSRLHHNPSSGISYNNNNNQFSAFGDVSGTSGLTISTPLDTSASCNSFLGFNYPLTLGGGGGGGAGGGGDGFSATQNMMSSMNVHSSLASSIESLSSINQDLHWKLQQQRLAMLFGSGNDHDQSTQTTQSQLEQQQKTQQIAPISLFQNLEVSSKADHQHQHQVVGTHGRREGASASGDTATEWFFGNSYAPPVTPTPTNSGGGNGGGGGNENTSNWQHGIQAWSSHDLQQYNALP
ncbi:unnamed protein product [Prunus armeniaca]|uniref:Dof zinc finger protein n=1 Tax=Prunus armeniaca TaxID=36596 RepID=A0A6J5VDE1_PRUAR|nr:hypothetical protein GBA52_019892 [Prunus armeniaca]CAB4283918.1 unnamed protein product [Prunus armeniaca]CAB4314352.1 unnamed protein product [Prunus armeniaca]